MTTLSRLHRRIFFGGTTTAFLTVWDVAIATSTRKQKPASISCYALWYTDFRNLYVLVLVMWWLASCNVFGRLQTAARALPAFKTTLEAQKALLRNEGGGHALTHSPKTRLKQFLSELLQNSTCQSPNFKIQRPKNCKFLRAAILYSR